MDFKNNIINIFENATFNEKYGNDISITIVLIIITIFVTVYFLILGTIKSQRAVWENNKCNPFFMPFASIITDNKDSEGKYKNNYNEENFNQCLNELNYEVGSSFKTPLDSMLTFIMGIFNFAASVVNQIFSFFLYLLNLILEFFKLLIGYVADLINRSNVVLQNFMSIIYFLLDTIDIIKYTIMNLFEFLALGFFLLVSKFGLVFVIPSVATFILLSMIAAIAAIMAALFGWLPFGGGVPFIVAASITALFVISSFIIMVFFILLFIIISKGVKKAFCESKIMPNIPCD
jgi:hypothetical protein